MNISYTFYIYTSYGIVFSVLAWQLWLPWQRWRKIKKPSAHDA